MISSGLARRYAKALYHVATEASITKEVFADLTLLEKVLSAMPNFEKYICNPTTHVKKKFDLIDKVFSEKLNKTTLDLLKLLLQKKREFVLKLIIEEYCNIYRSKHNIMLLDVYSAAPLSNEEKESLTQKLESFSGSKVIIKYHLDPTLIAGIRIREGYKVYDGSVKFGLERLKNSLRSSQA